MGLDTGALRKTGVESLRVDGRQRHNELDDLLF